MQNKKINKGKNSQEYDAKTVSSDDNMVHMKPSAELLEFYRKKIEDHNKDYSLLEEQLEMCKKVSKTNHYAQEELIKRNDEVAQLTKAVGDLQIYLYQERDHVLKLSAENDKLRLVQLDYHKKLNTVLSFAGLPKDFITFICLDDKENYVIPRKKITSNIVSRNVINKENKGLINDITVGEKEINELKIQALIAEWEEQSELYRDQLHSLLWDRDLIQKEFDVQQERLQTQIENLNEILSRCQSGICADTNRLLEMEKEHRKREKRWIDEKESLLKCLEASHEAYHTEPQNIRLLKSQLSSYKKQLIEKNALISIYKDQIAAYEEIVEKLKDDKEVVKSKHKEKCSKFINRINYFKKIYEEEKRRRLLEAEGFRNDIKFLQERVKILERKISSHIVTSSE